MNLITATSDGVWSQAAPTNRRTRFATTRKEQQEQLLCPPAVVDLTYCTIAVALYLSRDQTCLLQASSPLWKRRVENLFAVAPVARQTGQNIPLISTLTLAHS